MDIRKALLQQLPVYSGDTLLSEYFITAANIATALEAEEDDMIKVFPAKLRGKALKAYLKLSDFEKSTWKRLGQALAEKLVSSFSPVLAQEELYGVRQKEDEDIDTFVTRVENLVRIAYQPLDEAGRQLLLVQSVIRGLDDSLFPEIRRKINNQTDKEQLIRLVEAEVAVQKEAERRRKTRESEGLLNAVTEEVNQLAINYQEQEEEDFEEEDEQEDEDDDDWEDDDQDWEQDDDFQDDGYPENDDEDVDIEDTCEDDYHQNNQSSNNRGYQQQYQHQEQNNGHQLLNNQNSGNNTRSRHRFQAVSQLHQHITYCNSIAPSLVQDSYLCSHNVIQNNNLVYFIKFY